MSKKPKHELENNKLNKRRAMPWAMLSMIST